MVIIEHPSMIEIYPEQESAMNRRSFLRHGGQAAALAPFWAAAPALTDRSRLEAQTVPAGVLRRIGITTVCFRDRFTSTRGKDAGPVPAGEELTLLTAPKFIADTLGLHNVEIWNAQFAEQSIDYCKQIRFAAEAVKSRITNIQVDGSENLSDPDAAKRAASVELIKRWMDRAAAVGAPTCRANTGGGPPDAWDVNRTADSFRQLAEYGRKIGVKILVENHVGYSADIDKVVAIIKAVNDPFCRAICDWGNSPSNEGRVGALSKLFPYLELVSAKELDFDENNKHINYDVVPIIKATEASGYKGIYSIEFYGKPPKDTVAAARDMIKALSANIRA
jgi:sugar phosphate isomerase/epimerase